MLRRRRPRPLFLEGPAYREWDRRWKVSTAIILTGTGINLAAAIGLFVSR